jgi:hypothetical protein
MTITRRDGTLLVASALDGAASVSGTDTSPITYTVDEIGFLSAGNAVPFPVRVDNVKVERYYSLINETFTDGARTNGASPGDAAWWTISNPSVTIVDDSAGIGSGNALMITPSAGSQGIVARFDNPGVVNLADGDSLTFSFAWRFTGTTDLNTANGLRFGLYNANATFTVSDSDTTARIDDTGYFVKSNPGYASSTGSMINRQTPGAEILSGTDTATIGYSETSISSGTTAHKATISVKRSGSSVLISSSLDGRSSAWAADASPAGFTFSEVGLMLGAATSPLIVDNLRVEYSPAAPTPQTPTVGGGTIASPAAGPAPAYGIGGTGFSLVKNWDFGSNGTIKTMSDLDTNFQYHDQFGTIANATNYGALTVASGASTKISGQPVEGVNTTSPVRKFFTDSLKTYLVPLDGAVTVSATSHNAGCGSFQATWTLPNGGSFLNQDMIWETRVRYITPPYFWLAIWTAGNQWNKGAEMDVVESFGYDNTPAAGDTNFDGRFWHSDVVGGTHTVNYSNWASGMSASGISSYDATQYHVWTWYYGKDNTYKAYVDGIMIQSGTVNWTLSGILGGTPINMSFLFDGTWGNTQVSSVNNSLAASALAGMYYEWDYSRVYLK